MAIRLPFNNSAKFIENLQKEYSPSVASFVESVMANQGSKAMANPARMIATDAKDTVRQFVSIADNAKETAALARRHNMINGTVSGAVAAAFLTGEGAYSAYATQDSYSSFNEAVAGNFGRVATTTGTTIGAAHFLSRPGLGNKLFGLAFALGATYSVGAGTITIATNQMDAITVNDIEKAQQQLDAAVKQEENAAALNKKQIDELKGEADSLKADRDKILSGGGIPEALKNERARLQEKLDHLQNQLAAYNAPKGSDTAKHFIEQGYDNVSINKDGDASNDVTYRELKQQREEEIAATKEQLAPITEEINKRTLNAGQAENLSAEDRQRLTDIDARIKDIQSQISELSHDKSLGELRNARLAASQTLRELQDAGVDKDENLMERLQKFANTQNGFTATSTGLTFSILSVLGGMAVHHAMNTFSGQKAPKIARGTKVIAGIPVDIAKNSELAAAYEPMLNSFRTMMEKGEGVENALMKAASNEIAMRRDALTRALNKGIITQEQFTAGSKALTNAENNLPAMLRTSDFAKNMTRVLKTGAPEVAADTAKAAMTGEKATNAGLRIIEKGAVREGSTLASKIGSKIPVIGIAFAAGSLGLLEWTFSSQRAYAEELHKSGLLSDEGLNAYQDMNTKTQTVMSGDSVINGVDPTIVIGSLVSLGAESTAQSWFRDWYDKYGANLSKDQMNNLSMSLFQTPTVQDQIIKTLGGYIPMSTEGQPECLHKVIEAKLAMRDFVRNHPEPNIPMMAPAEITQDAFNRRKEWLGQLDTYRQNYVSELTAMAADPANMDAYLNLLPISERLGYARRLATGEENKDMFAQKYPAISRYINEYNGAFLHGIFGLSADDALYDDPEKLNKYIMDRIGMTANNNDLTPPAATIAETQLQQNKLPVAAQ